MTLEYDGIADESGASLTVRSRTPLPADAMVAVHLLTDRREFVKAEKGFCDSDGDLCIWRPVFEDEFILYLPYGAMRYPAAGEYTLRATVVRSGGTGAGEQVVGRGEMPIDLPQPRPWDQINHLQPLLDLCMMVTRADGAAVPEKVRYVKHAFTEQFDLDGDDVKRMRDAMKLPSPHGVRYLTDELRLRFLNLDPSAVVSLLVNVAKSDGGVTAAERGLVLEVAEALGFCEAESAELAERLGLCADIHYWAVLQLGPGATLAEITAAYRRLVSQYHPDRFSGHPEEFRALAAEKTIQISEAYRALKARFR